jgi:hypothetical protein
MDDGKKYQTELDISFVINNAYGGVWLFREYDDSINKDYLYESPSSWRV